MHTQKSNFHFSLPLRAALSLFFVLASFLSQGRAQEKSDVFISPTSGEMRAGKTFTVQFPQPMAKLAEIGKETDNPPMTFRPSLEGVFLWRSAREGQFRVTGGIKPGTEYTFHLRPKLTDLQGGDVSAIPVVSYKSKEFLVTRKPRSYRKALPASPTTRIGFNYPVALEEAAKQIYFQDRDSRERYAAHLILDSKAASDTKNSNDFSVQPARPFPPGKTIDLIIDGLTDAQFQQSLPHLQVFPLGNSQLLTIDSLSAYYPPLDEPRINIRGSASFDVDTINSQTLSIQPAVEDFKAVASGSWIRLSGKFDSTGKYTVTVGEGVKSTTGYPLKEPTTHEVAFDGISSSIYFPQSTLFQRTGRGLDFLFVHANTSEVEWKLSHIPEHQLAAVLKRNKEFERNEVDPLSGKPVWDEEIEDYRQVQTELLTKALRLETVATGKFAAAAKSSVETRRIQWKSDGAKPLASGAYLLEVSGTTPGTKRVLGNRSIIFFNDLTITQKATKDETILKVTSMETADAATGAEIEVVSHDNVVLAKSRTNAEGIARMAHFPSEAAYFLVRSDKGTARQYVNPWRFMESGYVNRNRPDRNAANADDDKLNLAPTGTIFTDRNLYRPGREVRAKGLVRIVGTGEPFIPEGAELHWQITSGFQGELQASGITRVDEFGGWECAWQVPESAKLGGYWVGYRLPEFSKKDSFPTQFQVQDFRVPLFQVKLGKPERKGESVEIPVSSHYFHGGPNAGARVSWEASLEPNYGYSNGISFVDTHSEKAIPEPPARTWNGTAKLDSKGQAIISLQLPITKPYARSRFDLKFKADVISPEGRTITNRIQEMVQLFDAVPGVSISTTEASETEKARVDIDLRAVDARDEAVEGVTMQWELHHVAYSTVKEKLGPGFFRYQNFDKYTLIHAGEAKSGETIPIDVEQTGRFVAVAWLAKNRAAPPASDDANMTGRKRATYVVSDDTNIEVKSDKESYRIGETAKLALEAPFGGKAWVSVETDKILEQFVTELPVNATSIDVPIKKSYFPNAYVTVYLLKPGGPDRLPSERFGKVRIEVQDPKRVIEVTPTVSTTDFRPGQTVQGEVLVQSDGTPVANADLTVFAVDEAILKLGNWSLPKLVPAFFPQQYHCIITFMALQDHFESIKRGEVYEKGFLIGGGGPLIEAAQNVNSNVRRNFSPIAYWKTELRTNADGVAKFDFKAPDNLTEFRITAVAQTRSNAFGTGKTSFKISKKLMVEPALPRFLRQEDMVELRAVARQTVGERETIVVKCITDSGLELEPDTESELSMEANKDTPAIFRFKARVGDVSHTRVRFEGHVVNHPEETDVVETPLLIHLPGLPVKTARYGEAELDEQQMFQLGDHVPESWSTSPGTVDLSMSYNPWLPKLRGLPYILEYPHGCFEQKGTRYFTYTTLGELLAYLPDVGKRQTTYGQRVEQGLREYEESLLKSGFLPYWPGGKEPAGFVSILAAWNVAKAKNAGFKVPVNLDEALTKAMDLGIRGKVPKSINSEASGDSFYFPKAFALYVHSESGGLSKYDDVLDDLFRNRDKLSLEDRAFLAMAMENYEVMADEKTRLVEELDHKLEKFPFDPRTFSSTARAEAVIGMARLRLGGKNFRKQDGIQKLKALMLERLDDSRSLSTQENMWTLLLFQDLQKREKFATFAPEKIAPKPGKLSRNAVSVGWETQSSSAVKEFAVKLDKGASRKTLYYHAAAEIVQKDAHKESTDEGFHLERTVTNLTDTKRTGAENTPFQLGDELLITYRIMARQQHHYVALTDELPAGIETVNFNLPQVAEFYDIPDGAAESTLFLDHSELRGRSANLYFNRVKKGAHTYSILGRVTAAGTFTWPGAQVYPMYEERFGGFSSLSPCHAVAD